MYWLLYWLIDWFKAVSVFRNWLTWLLQGQTCKQPLTQRPLYVSILILSLWFFIYLDFFYFDSLWLFCALTSCLSLSRVINSHINYRLLITPPFSSYLNFHPHKDRKNSSEQVSCGEVEKRDKCLPSVLLVLVLLMFLFELCCPRVAEVS